MIINLPINFKSYVPYASSLVDVFDLVGDVFNVQHSLKCIWPLSDKNFGCSCKNCVKVCYRNYIPFENLNRLYHINCEQHNSDIPRHVYMVGRLVFARFPSHTYCHVFVEMDATIGPDNYNDGVIFLTSYASVLSSILTTARHLTRAQLNSIYSSLREDGYDVVDLRHLIIFNYRNKLKHYSTVLPKRVLEQLEDFINAKCMPSVVLSNLKSKKKLL